MWFPVIVQNRDGTDVTITLDQMLEGAVGSESQYCIFKVHNVLRNVKEKAYEPEIIAIGPFHRGKSHLQTMEEHKLWYLKLLLQRKNERLSTYLDAMKPLEEEARKCYAEPIDLSSDKFVEMMVLDGCFIIELLRKFKMLIDSRRKNNHREEIKNDPPEDGCFIIKLLRKFMMLKVSKDKNDPREESKKDPPEEIRNDPLFRMDWTLNSLQRDLMLVENQLPFVILTKLYKMVELTGLENDFMDLALEFFNDLFPGVGKRNPGVDQDNIKHFLDLIRRNWSSEKLEPNRDGTYNIDNVNFIRCSTELAVAGIKFEKIDGKESSFDIQFSNGLLRIPVFTIDDRTESFLRNIMAYEQYCGDTNFNIVTDYMIFLGCLIKSAKDVEILSRNGIVRSFVRDDEVVYRMFSEMHTSLVVPSSNSHYVKIVKSVNEHCERRRNKCMAMLRRKYVNSSWGIVSIIVASILLLLTFLQALFQILSWKQPS